jgi:hypothetical protein
VVSLIIVCLLCIEIRCIRTCIKELLFVMYGKRKLAGGATLTLQSKPRCNEWAFNYSHAAGLGAL